MFLGVAVTLHESLACYVGCGMAALLFHIWEGSDFIIVFFCWQCFQLFVGRGLHPDVSQMCWS